MRETGSRLTQQAVAGQEERYPVLGNTLRQVPDEEQLPVSRYSAMYKIPRKEVCSPNPGKPSSVIKDTAIEYADNDDPFKDGIYNSGPVASTKPPSILSAGALAVENSAQDSRSSIEPRQTRTSSLRARLSAGHLVKDGQNKIVGFTDFTATPEPALDATRRDSLRARKEAQARRSLTPPAKPVPRPLRTNPSRESIGSNRAPAQFVAGSRRTTHPRRPSSRGSLRNEFREPTPPIPSSRPVPSRPAPAIPRNEDSKHGKSSEKAPLEISESKSSIPVPRQVASKMPRQPKDKTGVTERKTVGVNEVKKEARNEFAIYEGHFSSDMVRNLDQTLSDPSLDTVADTGHTYSASHPPQALVDNYGAHVLEAIEESPQHTYKLKRLSTASPEFGPILKISPSAKRLIMGPDTKREKNQLNKKKSKELDHAVVNKDQEVRPSSSQGLSRMSSRVGLIDTKVREKKVKSADLGRILPAIKNLLDGSHKLVPQLDHESTGAYANGSSTSTSFNDPFFDARSQLRASPEKRNDIDGQESKASGKESWIPPLGENSGVSNDRIHATTEFLPIDPHIENGIRSEENLPNDVTRPFEDTATAAKNLVKEPEERLLPKDFNINNGVQIEYKLSDSDEASPFEETEIVARDFGDGPKDQEDDASVIHLPFTPEQRLSKNPPNSDSHPPRSSSRMVHPDFTTAKNSPVSPLSAENRPPTPLKDNPKDFAQRQNNLGSFRGHGTSQLDLSNNASKRDSTARESNISQASASKGSLSIFRGLFHKRSSDNEPLKSGRKSKPKATATSPFPPISDVHPIHRPTLASIARSAATSTPRPATPTTPSLLSPQPTESSSSTRLAMQLLDLSRKERSSPKKEQLLQLGSVLVEGITQARNAERAFEEAKQAARRAEVACALCTKSLAEVTKCVEGWRDSY